MWVASNTADDNGYGDGDDNGYDNDNGYGDANGNVNAPVAGAVCARHGLDQGLRAQGMGWAETGSPTM